MPFQGQIKRSTTPGATPTLAAGELGANLTDGLLWAGTGSGVIQLASAALFASQAAGRFYAAPSAAAGAPSFRAIAAADLAAAPAVPTAAFLRGDLAWSNALALGSLTTAVSALTITGTWNNAAVTFPGAILVNMTDTADNGAVLLDLQVGSASVWRAGKAGNVYMTGKVTQAAYTNAGPAAGDSWFDSGRACAAWYDGMTGYRVGLAYSQVTRVTLAAPSAGSLLDATTAAGTPTLPANELNVLARVLRVRAHGYLTTGGTSGSTAFAVYLGATCVATCPAIAVATSQANVPWTFECDITCKATGSSGKLDAGGLAAAGVGGISLPVANGGAISTIAPQTQATVDLTSSQFCDFRASSPSAGNSVTLNGVTYEVLG